MEKKYNIQRKIKIKKIKQLKKIKREIINY